MVLKNLHGSSGDTDIEKRLMDTAGVEEGESGKYGENTMKAYITICKIGSQQEFAVWLRKLKQGPCINLEAWDWEGGSKGRGYMYTYG